MLSKSCWRAPINHVKGKNSLNTNHAIIICFNLPASLLVANHVPAGGPMAVILNGDFHRQISSMQAGSMQTPGFSQLYILDPAEAMEHRRTNPTFTGEKITSENAFVQGH
uniref:Uncharacterized protein n=1 Tax=Globodera rostochiensis TaxID=31243 RepID=A0A914HRI2_GLORO